MSSICVIHLSVRVLSAALGFNWFNFEKSYLLDKYFDRVLLGAILKLIILANYYKKFKFTNEIVFV